MSEQFCDVGGGVTLCYETFGEESDPTALLIMGLGTQMVAWQESFCRQLAARGLHVVRFDNRDIGRSTHMHGPPPTTAQVLQVTEHPGASSYPSGHTMFIVTVTVVLMLCFGHRFLPRWALAIGWALAALIVIANGISRIYTGAHWPSDVAGGILIASAWLSFWVSLGWVSRRALHRDN